MSEQRLAGRYIVAGDAWYRVTGEDAERVYCVVAAGSARVLERACSWYRSELAATMALGECRIVVGPPPSALRARSALEEIDGSKTHTIDGKRK